MRLRPGQPRAALIVAPHPDDEAIAAYGLIVALRRAGCAVRVLIVTDGEASHPGSLSWPPARLARTRRRESQRVLRAIGITRDRVAFLGLPDGGLEALSPCRSRAITRAAARVRGLALLAGPSPRDGHEDHRAVARALASARLPGVRRLAYQVWPLGRRIARARIVTLTEADRVGKRAAIARYRTQFGAVADRRPGDFALSARERAKLSSPREVFEVTR